MNGYQVEPQVVCWHTWHTGWHTCWLLVILQPRASQGLLIRSFKCVHTGRVVVTRVPHAGDKRMASTSSWVTCKILSNNNAVGVVIDKNVQSHALKRKRTSMPLECILCAGKDSCEMEWL